VKTTALLLIAVALPLSAQSPAQIQIISGRDPAGPCTTFPQSNPTPPVQYNLQTGNYFGCTGTAPNFTWQKITVTTGLLEGDGKGGSLQAVAGSGPGWLHGTGNGFGLNNLNITLSAGKGTPDRTGPNLTAAMIGYAVAPAACSLGVSGQSSYYLMVDGGTATVAVLKVAAGTALPTYASNSISMSGWSISTGTVVENTNLSDLTTTTINAGDILGFYLTAASGVTFVQVGVTCQQS
jgi:hypothetical protein